MRQLQPANSLLSYLESLEYTEAALLADADTEDLAAPFTTEIKNWEGVFKSERATRRDVVRAEAVVSVRNAQVDETTTRFGAVVLAEAGADRKSPLFRRFFPVAPSEFIRQPLRAQCESTVNVLLPEIDRLDKTSALKPFAPKLRKGAEAATQALDARSKAKAGRAMKASDTAEWKEGVNRLRLSTYAELLRLSAEKGYGRAWAETFFATDSTSGEPDVEPEPAPSPTPAPAPNP